MGEAGAEEACQTLRQGGTHCMLFQSTDSHEQPCIQWLNLVFSDQFLTACDAPNRAWALQPRVSESWCRH